MDGIGGTVKNLVFRDVKSQKCIINGPKEFADYAEKRVNGIHSLYLPVSDVMVEPEDISNAPKIPETLKIHKVERCFDANKACYLKFSYLSNDDKPYFTQHYRKEDKDVCGHVMMQSNDENHCSYCNLMYKFSDIEWLQCPTCKGWFHHNCFYE